MPYKRCHLTVNYDGNMTELPTMQEFNISFTSLGSVVLDEIRCPNRQPLTDILGGSGTYGELLLLGLGLG
jgi:hypothetical protein